MQALFDTLIYTPIFNIFVGMYNYIPDVGVVIVILTIIIRILLMPANAKSIKAQKSLSELQPKLQDLKEKHKDNQQLLAQETMKLYKDHKVNPFGSCLPILIQIPLFLAFYWVLRDGLTTDNFDKLYPFISSPGHINSLFMGMVDLAKPQVWIAALAAAAQYFQVKMLSKTKAPKDAGEGGKDENMAAMMNKQMTFMMPGITLIIGFSLPGGLLLYWLVSTLFAIGQQKFVFKEMDKLK